MVEAVKGSSTMSKSLSQVMSGDDFLKLFVTELENQNPLEPQSNADLLNQVSQITNLEMIRGLSDGIHSLVDQNWISQASGLLAKTVSYTDANGKVQEDVVGDVRVNANGDVIVGLMGGATTNIASILAIR